MDIGYDHFTNFNNILMTSFTEKSTAHLPDGKGTQVGKCQAICGGDAPHVLP